MTINLTQIMVAVITLIGALVARYVIPWIKGQMDDRQYDMFLSIVRVGVFAAEQLYKAGHGEEKKQYVIDLLKEKGYEVDCMAVDAAIEAAVKELHIEGGEDA